MVNISKSHSFILWRFLKGFDYYLDNTESNFKITRAIAEKEVNKKFELSSVDSSVSSAVDEQNLLKLLLNLD
jgi:hypothetical protein